MWFAFNGCAIALGGVLGGLFSKKIKSNDLAPLSIGIMLISLVGLLENILTVSDTRVIGEHTVIVTIALVAGCAIGNLLKIEDRLSAVSDQQGEGNGGFINATLFFGIGGLQVSAPILYVLEGDFFQLILKGIIDFPFALMLGAAYGKKVSLSAIPVVVGQLLIGALAWLAGDFISDALLCQLCSLGYLILFFSGFNMLCPTKSRIKNINFVPGMLLIILYNVFTEVVLK